MASREVLANSGVPKKMTFNDFIVQR